MKDLLPVGHDFSFEIKALDLAVVCDDDHCGNDAGRSGGSGAVCPTTWVTSCLGAAGHVKPPLSSDRTACRRRTIFAAGDCPRNIMREADMDDVLATSHRSVRRLSLVPKSLLLERGRVVHMILCCFSRLQVAVPQTTVPGRLPLRIWRALMAQELTARNVFGTFKIPCSFDVRCAPDVEARQTNQFLLTGLRSLPRQCTAAIACRAEDSCGHAQVISSAARTVLVLLLSTRMRWNELNKLPRHDRSRVAKPPTR